MRVSIKFSWSLEHIFTFSTISKKKVLAIPVNIKSLLFSSKLISDRLFLNDLQMIKKIGTEKHFVFRRGHEEYSSLTFLPFLVFWNGQCHQGWIFNGVLESCSKIFAARGIREVRHRLQHLGEFAPPCLHATPLARVVHGFDWRDFL
jgi:hypothetical protein